MKNMLVTAPFLAYDDAKKPTVIIANASSYRIGNTLLQEHDGKMSPMAFCSCALTLA